MPHVESPFYRLLPLGGVKSLLSVPVCRVALIRDLNHLDIYYIFSTLNGTGANEP